MIWTYWTIFKLLDAEKRRRFFLIVLLMMVVGVLDLAGVAMIVPFLAVLANPDVIAQQPILTRAFETLDFATTDGFLRFLGVVTFVLVMTGIALRALSFYLANLFARQVDIAFGMARLRRYLAQPYEWFLQQHSADLSKSVLQEINEIVNGSVLPALRVIANSFLILLLSGLLLAIEPIGAMGVAVLFGASFWVVDRALRTQIREMGEARRLANRERHQVTGEALSGIKEVKMMGLETTYLGRFLDPSLRLASFKARISLIGEMPRFALEALTFGGMLAFTLYILWTNDGSLDRVVPVLGAFAFAALRLMPTAQLLFRDVSQIRFGQAALQGLRTDLATPPALGETGEAGDPVPLRREIRLRDVSYVYPKTDLPSLRDVSVTIEAGATVGFVGATGAGKSTVIDLILGLVRPTEGQIEVDGVALGAENRRAWQRQVGFVPQTIHLVDESIAANVAYGTPRDEIDMERVQLCAEMAQIADFAEGLPEGYETWVGDAGVRLSGGQRQRIGIARALYRDHDVLVFDEATSALDPVTEREVMGAIRRLHGAKTLILVSHRLNTLTYCDEIFLLKDGQVVDRGTHGDLRSSNTEFRSMLAAVE
ncbi:MAG: ABC transporter ATP-binding protein [Pseudomonadota bacterium]